MKTMDENPFKRFSHRAHIVAPQCDLGFLQSESVIESESVSASEIKAAYARTTCSGVVGWTSFYIEVLWLYKSLY